MRNLLTGLVIGVLITYALHIALQAYSHYTFTMEDATLTYKKPCDVCELKGTLKHASTDGWYKFITNKGITIEFPEKGGPVNHISTKKMIWYFEGYQRIEHLKKNIVPST